MCEMNDGIVVMWGKRLISRHLMFIILEATLSISEVEDQNHALPIVPVSQLA